MVLPVVAQLAAQFLAAQAVVLPVVSQLAAQF
eukprot:SAG31_NODE_48685_length_174_cov_10.346667_1_plen_31_part_01